MNNLYLIESTGHKAINLEIDKILKKHDFSRDNLITYDLDETNISDVINDLDTYGFFCEKKIIYASNATFLTTNKSEIEHNVDSLTRYINNPSDNVLIISCSKLDGKKNICKLIKEKFECVTISSDPKDYIKKKTKDYKITYDTINYLLYTVGEDIDRLDNEIDKVEGTYLFYAPLALKDETSFIIYQDTLDGWYDETLEKLTISALMVKADVNSEIPLKVEISFNPIDVNGKIIKNVKSNVVKLNATKSMQPIEINLEGEIKNLDGIIIRAKLIGAQGESIAPSQTINFKNLKIAVTGDYVDEF